MNASPRTQRSALLITSLLLCGTACGSLTGLNDLEADPSFEGVGASGSGGSAGSGGATCVELDEVDKVGVMVLVEGGMASGTREALKTAVLATNPGLSELYVGWDFFPEPGPPTCGEALIGERPVMPPNRQSDVNFPGDVEAFFNILGFAPEGPDAPEQGLRYSAREFQRTPSFEASAALVITQAQVFGCDDDWTQSAQTARNVLAMAPFSRTYVMDIDGTSSHTENLATAGATLPFDGLPASELALALELIHDELKECTFYVADAPQPRLWFDGDEIPRTDPEICASNGSDGFYQLGQGKVGLCPVTCLELLNKKLLNDPEAVVRNCGQ